MALRPLADLLAELTARLDAVPGATRATVSDTALYGGAGLSLDQALARMDALTALATARGATLYIENHPAERITAEP